MVFHEQVKGFEKCSTDKNILHNVVNDDVVIFVPSRGSSKEIVTYYKRKTKGKIQHQNLGKSNRESRSPPKFASYESFYPKLRECLSAIHSYTEPTTYNEVIQALNWRKTIDVEVEALEKYET